MPYIKQNERRKWNLIIKDILNLIAEIPKDEVEGELNYLISTILKKVYKDSGEKYFKYNKMIGLIECIKLEAYLQFVSKYEMKKKKENGGLE
jgi:hypothetical protein